MNAENQQQFDDLIHIGSFFLDEEEFGVDLLKYQSIIRPMEITRVPCAESFVEGAINLRGTIIPVINLRTRFGMPPRPQDSDTRIINMEIEGLVLGFIVDKMGQVQRIPRRLVGGTPPLISSVDSQYIEGVCTTSDDHLLILLNMDKVLTPENLAQLAAM